MEIEIQLTAEPIAEKIPPWGGGSTTGAWLEFRGVVRGEESGQPISALEYEAYPEMAERELRRILESLAKKFPCLAAKVIHRVGIIPVGDTAIYVGIGAAHRGEAIALLAEFMDRLKQDVPIWKRGARSAGLRPGANQNAAVDAPGRGPVLLSLDEALSEIQSHCQPLSAVRIPLAEAFGRVLRETVCAPEDLPPFDRSTRDGFGVLQDDASTSFRVVDAHHAADWKPRILKTGEAVRVATGSALPCGNLRVVMQENVERNGDQIRLIRRETARNISVRGEDLRAGEPLLKAGAKLDAGALALLATAGNVNPLVSPRLRVCHFTTGDEIIPPSQKPKPGQIRDSNSFLIRGLLRTFPCELTQKHLPENFEAAQKLLSPINHQLSTINLLLISGGASVGDKDFTRPLLEWLGFEIVFAQVNVRPGRPLIFGVNSGGARTEAARQDPASRIAFGLPGNPLSHFVCFQLFVAAALAKLAGAEPKTFQRGRLTAKLDDPPNPRETLWPARLDLDGLHPLKWSSSGDVTCLAETNALFRVPANRGSMEAGGEVDFLPA
jgi:molybdopterin molybdotransferase